MTDIEARIAVIESKMNDIDENWKSRWKAHDYQASEYRQEIRLLIQEMKAEVKEILGKLDEYINRLSQMPCKEHIQKFCSYESQFRLIWVFIISVIVGGICFGIFLNMNGVIQ